MRGRPVITTHAAIEQAAFELFELHGFTATTIQAIARRVGVGTRTISRYYPSKNDIPWGQFARTLEEFRQVLATSPAEMPIHESVHRGVLAFNRFPADAQPSHRTRMRLILTTPELQAHSVHQYAAWRQVIAGYVADRLGVDPDTLTPQLAGRVSLALALAAYDVWLDDEGAELLDILDDSLHHLEHYLGGTASIRA
ncbi:mycofactocin system transcriptional regulator [Nocardioides pacificus]